MAHQAKSDDLIETLLRYARDQTWKVVKNSSGIAVACQHVPNRSERVYRGVGIVEAPPSQVLQYVTPSNDSPRKQWDTTSKEWNEIERIDEHTSIVQSVTKAAMAGFIKGRDFVDLVCRKQLENGAYICAAVSVDHPGCPPTSSLVRGTNYHSGLVCFPVDGDPNKTELVFVVHSALGGMLPMSIVESALPSSIVKFITELRGALKKAAAK
ncbi:stAR-related lipid transfer protein 5-like [Oscarella lobularis]|uniref:stAR-related lipid transfer protein 5-like n=1 Tax=Oscarella lobularis TaxID=121494 RepID=UPI0033139E0C